MGSFVPPSRVQTPISNIGGLDFGTGLSGYGWPMDNMQVWHVADPKLDNRIRCGSKRNYDIVRSNREAAPPLESYRETSSYRGHG